MKYSSWSLIMASLESVQNLLNDTDAADSTLRCRQQLAFAKCRSKVYCGII